MSKIYKVEETLPGDYEVKAAPTKDYILVIKPSQPPQVVRWCTTCGYYENSDTGYTVIVDYWMEIPYLSLING